MATAITHYKGYVSKQSLDIYTVPAGKLAKVFFREMGVNRVLVNQNMIRLESTDGVVFFGSVSSGSTSQDLLFPDNEGEKLTSLDYPPFRNGFLIVPGTKIRVVYPNPNYNGSAVIYYDFTVIEEDM